MIAKLSLKQKIGTQPKKIWQDFQMQIMFIAVDFDTLQGVRISEGKHA